MTSKALLVLVALSGCADFDRGPVAEEPPDAGEVMPVDGGSTASSFATSVEPLLTSVCLSCHRPAGAAGSSHLVLTGTDDLAQVLLLVDTSNPASSRLLTKASGTSHGGGVIFAAGSAEYQTLFTWISEGAAP